MKHLLVPILMVGVALCLGSSEDEGSCSALRDDGTQDCGREANVWKSTKAEDSVLDYFKTNGVSLTKLELDLILNFLKEEGGDGRVDLEDLRRMQEKGKDAMAVVDSLLLTFNRLDSDDDGVADEDEEVTFPQYLKLVGSSLGEEFLAAVEPFEGFSFLSPEQFKRAVATSVRSFRERDEDSSGGLDMAEYLAQVNRAENKAAGVMDEAQKEAIFALIDTDSDGEISYREFQAVIPQMAKQASGGGGGGFDMGSLFDKGDRDKDGLWDESEFEAHLKVMVAKTGAPFPSESEVRSAFSHLDKDGDGRISKSELEGIQGQIEAIQKEKATKGFEEMDANGDGVLSRDEMAGMASLMAERTGQKVDVDLLIKMMDRNGNGIVELDEVQALVDQMIPKSKSQQQQFGP